MPRTKISGKQIHDNTLQKNNFDITTANSAVITNVIPGTNISITYTGVDQGTGAVTINLNLTSSSQLASIISDETGSGLLVFATSPIFTTSVATDSQTFAVFNTTATTVNAFGAATTLNLGAATGITTINNSLTITGNLIVNGTTSTINSTVITIDDPIFVLGGDTAPQADDNKDRGIEFRWHNGTAAKIGFFGFDDSAGKFTFIPDATDTSGVISGTKGTIDANLEWLDILNRPDIAPQVIISDSVPLATLNGGLWWDCEDGNLKIYYNDGDTSQWVDAFSTTAGPTGSDVYINSSPPTPSNGRFWLNSDTKVLYLYYDNNWNIV
jgi:hypothetical protein